MAAGGMGEILLTVIAILFAAKLAGELFERLGQPAVLGELLAGVALGPSLLAFIPPVIGAHAAEAAGGSDLIAVLAFVAQLGALILLFEVGLESNIRELVNVGRAATFVALIGIVASMALGYFASWAFAHWVPFLHWPDRTILHVFMGATFAATSVGITARVLSDMGKLATPEARIILGAAVMDDVGALLVLAVVTALAAGDLSLSTILVKGGVAIGFLVASLLVGIKLAPPLFTRLSNLRVRGIVMSSAIVFALAMAYVAELVGLAGIVGAFAAGLILAQTREHHQIFEGTRPVGDVFIPFFFVIMGVAVDMRAATEVGFLNVVLVAGALTIVAIFAKYLCGYGVRRSEANRAIIGVGMVPRGEVGLIFAAFGLTAAIIEEWEYTAVLLVVMLTTFITPLWLRQLFRKSTPRTRAALAANPRTTEVEYVEEQQ